MPIFLSKTKDTCHHYWTHEQREMTEATRLSLLEVVQLTGYITKVQQTQVDLWNLWTGSVQQFSVRTLCLWLWELNKIM